jgi:flagellar biosynthesis/type III secretory pathway ATPase
MGARALEFSLAHPDDSPGYATAVKELEAQLIRANQLAREQEAGTVQVRVASAQKRVLRRAIRRVQLVHLARVAERGSKEIPELAQKFDLPRVPTRYLPFKNVARTMLAEAQLQKELLVRHGLAERVLEGLSRSLDEFDQAVELGAEGRRIHIGAAANLEVASDEVVQLVRVIDGLNRFRFAAEADLMAAWGSASNVIGPPHPADRTIPPFTDEVKPAA